MLKNYFLIALRSFKKDKTNALISLSGLIVGLTCVMLIVGYIRYETSFDTSYGNADRIYRVISKYKKNDAGKTELVPEAFAPTLVREVPEVQAQTHISTWQNSVLKKEEYNDILISDVDSDFFSVFNFKFISGNAVTALTDPNNIVLTESSAKKFFNTSDNIVGKTLTTKYGGTLKITGVVQDLPQNSFLQTEAFHFHSLKNQTLDASLGAYYPRNAFILLSPNVPLSVAQNKIQQFCRKYKMNNYEISLQPVQDIHLRSAEISNRSEFYNIGNIAYVYIYGSIALLILIIGGINFINLSIARSLERTKEIGVRKVFGAKKNQLVIQFIGESSLYFFTAFPVALLLASVLWKSFIGLLNIQANISYLLNTFSVSAMIGICIFSSLISSLYPAFFLSRLMPVITLKGAIKSPKINLGLRKILVVAQFSISMILIMATLIIHAQLNYLNNKPLGFNKDNLLRVEIPVFDKDKSTFKNRILQNNNVIAAALSSADIAHQYGAVFSIRDPKDSAHLLDCAYFNGDFDFIKTLQVPVVEGRDFSPKFPSDAVNYDSSSSFFEGDTSQSIIVSESLVKVLNLQNPVGKTLNTDWFKGRIVGVIKQFSGMSLKGQDPLIMIKCSSGSTKLTYFYTRINAINTSETINYISKTFKQFFPQEKFDYAFVDDRIAHLYDLEIRLTKLFNIFAFLAIVISCTGLFSLVSLMVRKRTKEIGIRKVMGASVKDIVLLISKDFIWLIIISFIIATPLAYIAMSKWLQGYANKTKIYWWIFAIAGIVAFIIAFASIGFKSVAAAKANPVDSLRDE